MDRSLPLSPRASVLAAACLLGALASALPAAPVQAQALLDTLTSPNQKRYSEFGTTVSGVPDVDGDGFGDLLVGASREGSDPREEEGRAYVFSGATGAVLHELVSPNAGENSHFGNSVFGLEDIDGDGRGDLLIAHPGSAYVFSGASGILLYELALPNEQEYGYLGLEVSGVPDVDGDGIPDLLVGDPGEYTVISDPYAGLVYVFSGATGALLYELSSPNEQERGYFGHSVSGLEDIDGDGRGDLLVSGPGEAGGGRSYSGRAYVFSGASGALLYEFNSPNEQAYGSFGSDVSGVEDVDGDGVLDLLVTASGEDVGSRQHAGRVYVLSGATGVVLQELAAPIAVHNGGFGYSVARVGDVDGDGRGDFLVGAPEVGYGQAYVFSGASGALLYWILSPNYKVRGFFGSDVSGVDDLDGDGIPDLLVGAYLEGLDSGLRNAGRAYVFSGAPAPPLTVTLTPHDPPIAIPPEGGAFTFDLTLTNTASGALSTRFWSELGHGGSEPIYRSSSHSITIAAGQSLTKTLTQSVPSTAPAGTYTYTAYTGIYPDVVASSDSLTFTKEGAAARQGAVAVTDWALVYAETGLPVADGDVWTAGEAAGEAADGAAASGAPAQASAMTGLPERLTLDAAHPNPFSTRTVLAYELPASVPVRLSVYDVLGREVAVLVDAEQAAGRHEAVLDGARLPSGTYVVRLVAGTETQARRITLVR